jgi:hypothetical protein
MWRMSGSPAPFLVASAVARGQAIARRPATPCADPRGSDLKTSLSAVTLRSGKTIDALLSTLKFADHAAALRPAISGWRTDRRDYR